MGQRFTFVSDDEVLVGTLVADRYAVGEVVGQGTTGTTFAARNVRVGAPCVLKVLRPRYVPLESVRRVFTVEAPRAWSVVHPCLPTIFDADVLPDGAPFFVSERLEGHSLAARMDRDRLSLAAATDVTMQLLATLEAIHARGLVVGDLRPHNLLLATRRGCRPLLKLMDFGLERLVPIHAIQREWETAAGRPDDDAGACALAHYLSPERARSEEAVSPASDIFVVGSILYEALAGQRAFDAPTFELLVARITQGDHIPLGEIRPDLPLELGRLVSRALSPHPSYRFASSREMQESLRAIFEPTRRPSSTRAEAADASPSSAPAAYESGAAPAMDGRTERPPARDVYDDFDDETRAHARFRPAESWAVDEASAENVHQRTVVPPPVDPNDSGSIDVEIDPLTPRGLASVRRVRDDEETQTLHVTPELRAQLAERAAPSSTPPPPPTRRQG